MAAITYKVERGDSLWKICAGKTKADPSAISGNTTNAKIDTLVNLNNIPNRNLIYPGQILTLSGTASGGSSSSSDTPPNNAVITSFGLQSDSSTGRDIFASWTWHRLDPDKDNFEKFKIRWEWDAPNPSKPGKYITKFQNDETINTWASFTIPQDFQKTANWAQIFITPIAKNRKNSKGDDIGPHWTANETSAKYNFADNPPSLPDKPVCEIENTTLTMKIDSIKNETDASYIIFQVVKDNTSAVYTSGKIPIVPVTDDYGKVSHTYTVSLGSNYKVRAKSVAANDKESGWTEFSDEAATKPSAPTMIKDSCRRVKRVEDDSQAAHLEWTTIPNATQYEIEYTNIESDFNNGSGNYNVKPTEDDRTSIDIVFTNDQLGKEYFFRVRAVNDDINDQDNKKSDPSNVISIPVGSIPDAPDTWMTSESAFSDDTTYRYDEDGNKFVDYTPMELNWVHMPTDNSKQSLAELYIKIGDNDPVSYIITNTTDADTTGERIDEETFTYGTAVSYKGTLYFKMDTNHPDFKNTTVQWKVRTAGIIDAVSDGKWSTERTIYIYEKPTLALSVTSDLAGKGPIIETLTSFPFYIRGTLSLTDFTLQRPVGYHLRIVSNDYYVTVDDVGRTKTVNPGDTVYSKYFDTSFDSFVDTTSNNILVAEMSANNLDLESGMSYKIYCNADMSTGLAVGNTHEFTVSWVDVEYAIDANVSVNLEAYTALITPYCREKIPTTVGEGDDAYTVYETGDLVEDVTLSIYRREYDGSYKEIATGIPNDYTSVTDPHPALDYARYRFTAKDKNTGALSFWDMAGYPVNGHAVIIQWDEEWSTFDSGENTSIEGPSWSGSLLKLPYNIKISDNRKRDKTLVNYVGREHPVSYYGTQLSEASQWSVEIPAYDKETIYALRRLSIWSGDVYIREPSGMGFWANVEVSFNKSYNDVKIPVTLSVTRVEGGI